MKEKELIKTLYRGFKRGLIDIFYPGPYEKAQVDRRVDSYILKGKEKIINMFGDVLGVSIPALTSFLLPYNYQEALLGYIGINTLIKLSHYIANREEYSFKAKIMKELSSMFKKH